MLFLHSVFSSGLTLREKLFLERLYLRESKRMWYTAVKILGSKEMAEDAVQQAFENIIKKTALLMSFDTPEKVRKYVLVSVRNVALGVLRSNKKTIRLEGIEFSLADEVDIEADFIMHSMVDDIKQLISTINPIYGDAFYLRYILDLDYSEIADALMISVSVAQHRVSRAKAMIRARKRGDCDG